MLPPAAIPAIGLIGGARDDIPVAPGIRIAPGDRRPRRAALQRLNLGSIGAALVVIIERRADATTDEGTDGRAARHTSDTIASAAPDPIADGAAGHCSRSRPATLL